MTLITKRDIQATRSHHSRHTERRFGAQDEQISMVVRRLQIVQFGVSGPHKTLQYGLIPSSHGPYA